MDKHKAFRALERMNRIVAAAGEIRRAEDGVLYEKGDVTITESDVDDAIEMARVRVGDEFASLLTAPAYVEK